MPTEIIAHRGASRERPENTLAAFARAAELGAAAVELDVHLTSDGHLVVHHDATLAGRLLPTAIRSLTLAEVGGFLVQGEPIPTLGAVVGLVGGRLRIYCELKGPGTAASAAAMLVPLGTWAAVHSFDHRMVAESGRVAPELARGVLETSYHRDACAAMRDVGARDLWQHEALIDVALVAAVHAAGGRVIAWTVDDLSRATELAALGVDGLCTNDVAGVRAAVVRAAVVRATVEGAAR